jgi:hypothetical protein
LGRGAWFGDVEFFGEGDALLAFGGEVLFAVRGFAGGGAGLFPDDQAAGVGRVEFYVGVVVVDLVGECDFA